MFPGAPERTWGTTSQWTAAHWLRSAVLKHLFTKVFLYCLFLTTKSGALSEQQYSVRHTASQSTKRQDMQKMLGTWHPLATPMPFDRLFQKIDVTKLTKI